VKKEKPKEEKPKVNIGAMKQEFVASGGWGNLEL